MKDSEAWRLDAACRGMSSSIFYNDIEGSSNAIYDEARRVCAGCPVVKECLEASDGHGVWGGMSPRAREAWRRRQRNLLRGDSDAR